MRILRILAPGVAATIGGCVPGSVLYLGAPVATIQGTVYALEDALPVTGAEICVQGSDTVCVRSNPDGTYKAYYPVEERVDIQFRIPGSRPAILESVDIIPPEVHRLLDCTLSTRMTLSTERGTCRSRPPALIQGVVGMAGVPVERALVCALGTEMVCDYSNSAGEFRLFYRLGEPVDLWFQPDRDGASVIRAAELVRNGSYFVRCGSGNDASPPGWGRCLDHVPATIQGTVRSSSDNAALAGVDVCVAGTFETCVESDINGGYTLFYHLPETIDLIFRSGSGRPARAAGVEVIPGGTTRVDCAVSTRFSGDATPVDCAPVAPGG